LWFLAPTKTRRGHCAESDQRIVLRAVLAADSGPDLAPFSKGRKGGGGPAVRIPFAPPTRRCEAEVFMFAPGSSPGVLPQAQAYGPFHQATDVEPPGGRIEFGDLKVIANVKVRARHDHATDQCGNRGLAVERVGAVHHQPRLDRALAQLIDRVIGDSFPLPVMPRQVAVLSIQPGRRRFLVEFRSTWHAAVARDGSIDHG
jgi:hypothetical protein